MSVAPAYSTPLPVPASPVSPVSPELHSRVFRALTRPFIQPKDRIGLSTVLEKLQLEQNLVAITGIGFGDEGKGRVVADLARQAHAINPHVPVIVLKVNGGANSGHTADGHVMNILPSGTVVPGVKRLVLGKGVVADPRKIYWEGYALEKAGCKVKSRLRIDNNTMVSDLMHRLLDLGEEIMRAKYGTARGSTGRGITPAFRDEVGQAQIFYSDLLQPDEFRDKMRARIRRGLCELQHGYKLTAEEFSGLFDTLETAEKKANAKHRSLFPEDEFSFSRFRGEDEFSIRTEELIDWYLEAGRILQDNIGPACDEVRAQLQSHALVLAEFGQAYLLGKREGFTPNTTASHASAAEVHHSVHIPSSLLHHHTTVTKAYDTKVGSHVFVTQIPVEEPLGALLSQIEFGATTGRQRMVGWYDAVEKGVTLRESGFHDMVINKLDALTLREDWNGPLKICVEYELENGNRVKTARIPEAQRKTAKPVYIELEGWTEDIRDVRNFAALPPAAQRYIAALYSSTIDSSLEGSGEHPFVHAPRVRSIGVGPDSGQFIGDVPSPSELVEMWIDHIKKQPAFA